MRGPKSIRVFGIRGIPRIMPGDDLAKLVVEAAKRQGTGILRDDIVVVSQKIVSKAEGRIVDLKSVRPSKISRSMASCLDKDPAMVELALGESNAIVRMGNGNLITETRQGWICANSGVDRSNVSGGKSATLLPLDSDRSARRLRRGIQKLVRGRVSIIVSDTFGRPHREGVVNVAIGVAGLEPILDLRGKRDLFGYTLVVKQVAVADELAAAAELAIGNTAEGVPVAVIRGYRNYLPSEKASATQLIRPRDRDLFR